MDDGGNVLLNSNLVCDIKHFIEYTVEPPRKGHFGTNINSSDLSPL